MKKNRVFSLLLVLVLTAALLSPAALAADTDSFSVDAVSALLIDLDTGAVLFEQDADAQIYPASLTKIVTAMLILDYGNLNELATVSATALQDVGDQSATLVEGESLTLDSLLYLIMVSSVNEACNVAAEHIAGSIDSFVEMMNQKAASLGCTGTHFTNTHGLHDADHYSTARDLGILAMAAVQTVGFMDYACTDEVTIPATEKAGQRTLITSNDLISTLQTDEYYYEPARGIKSGRTTEAGYCLISTAENDTMRLLSVLCGAEAVANSDGSYTYMNFVETQRMFEYGFTNFEVQTVLDTTETVTSVPALLSSGDQRIQLSAATAVTALMPLGYDPADVVYDVDLDEPDGVEAPTALGAELGTVTVRYGDRVLGSTALVATNAVTRSEFAYASQQFRTVLSNIYVKFVIAVLIAVVLLFFFHEIAAAPRRAYRKRLRKWEQKQARQHDDTQS
jgi:D-alanyl-D-alanine carboxypeptidase (penicillin-binding protein 5/6)